MKFTRYKAAGPMAEDVTAKPMGGMPSGLFYAIIGVIACGLFFSFNAGF